jgi:hypothetical protein
MSNILNLRGEELIWFIIPTNTLGFVVATHQAHVTPQVGPGGIHKCDLDYLSLGNESPRRFQETDHNNEA